MRTLRIFKRFYPDTPPIKPVSFWTRTAAWIGDHPAHIGACATVLLIWIGAHLYYYNEFIGRLFRVREAWAQVEAQRQRRYHIQANITNIVIGYARYEKDLMARLTTLRTSMRKEGNLTAGLFEAGQSLEASPGSLSMDQLDGLFSRIMVVAEQYPDLKLTANYQQLSKAIIDTETEIANRIMVHNEAVNAYTTVLHQFPGNIFGWITGFTDMDFYNPQPRALAFNPIQLDTPTEDRP